MSYQYIIDQLPYRPPFLFVDGIRHLDVDKAEGYYTLKKDEYFFAGHFPNQPVCPGVIVTEIMAQIGLVTLGLYLLDLSPDKAHEILPVFSSSQVDFLAPAFPGDRLAVRSEKIYFRFHKLKCKITCCNETTGKEMARGEFSGMMINKQSI